MAILLISISLLLGMVMATLIGGRVHESHHEHH
ncbi:hypothetical protein MUDAN_MDHGFNIF_00993 [Lactiplantibacillus mudanjiangensis]|uniref:Uncharacterized protein n=1 Tax=Lactiplantibacillus mudanjiangensis TaxID=1296538 RepID=A0A660DZZ6_9LACO|nr:hypothetical protein MUDAN_IGPPGNFN_01635 [Lactiplantibacillus mudanjiangensis]VDG29438.1 hypothetical protein MUDAN_MDHGFNIF_00993 [Lactiplantibacillus mudanjiangensis]